MRGLRGKPWAVAPIVGLVALAGCRNEAPDPEIVINRIELQESVPGGVYARDVIHPFDPVGGSYPDDLTLLFNRPVAVAELNFRFYPPPESLSSITASGTAGIIRIRDYIPRAGLSVQRILIDGPKTDEPYLLSFYAGDPAPAAGYVACVAFTRNSAPSTENALCMAFAAAQIQGITDERAVFDLEPMSVAIAYHGVAGPANRSTHSGHVAELPTGSLYTAAVIQDTNGDGVYDPSVDWWGVSTDPNSTSSWLPEWRAPRNLLEAEALEVELHAPR